MGLWLVSAACMAIMLFSLTMFMRNRRLLEFFDKDALTATLLPIPPQVFVSPSPVNLKWSSIPSYSPMATTAPSKQSADAPTKPVFKPPKHMAAASGFHCPVSAKYISALTGSPLTSLEAPPLTSQTTNKQLLKRLEYPAAHLQRVLQKRVDGDMMKAIKEWEWVEMALSVDAPMNKAVVSWIANDLSREPAIAVENQAHFAVPGSNMLAMLYCEAKQAYLYVCEWILYRDRSHAFHIVSTFVEQSTTGNDKTHPYTWIAAQVMGVIPEQDMGTVVNTTTQLGFEPSHQAWSTYTPEDKPEIIKLSFKNEQDLYCKQQNDIQNEHQITNMFSDPLYTCGAPVKDNGIVA